MIIHQIKQTKEMHLNEGDYTQLPLSPLALSQGLCVFSSDGCWLSQLMHGLALLPAKQSSLTGLQDTGTGL